MAPKDYNSVSYSSPGRFTAAEHIQCIWKHTDASTKWLVSLTNVYPQYVPLKHVDCEHGFTFIFKMYNLKLCLSNKCSD